jgi:hypothetical protein
LILYLPTPHSVLQDIRSISAKIAVEVIKVSDAGLLPSD